MVAEGRFREDLYARINMWNFAPARSGAAAEDTAPNVERELHRFSSSKQMQIRFDKEARACYLAFASSPQAQWRGNFASWFIHRANGDACRTGDASPYPLSKKKLRC